jgi:hypothetical protein
VGLTLKSTDSISRVSAKAAASPQTSPAPASANPCRTNMAVMSRGGEPSASRIPTSRVRFKELKGGERGARIDFEDSVIHLLDPPGYAEAIPSWVAALMLCSK